MPIWDMSWSKILYNCERLSRTLAPEFFNRYAFVALLPLFIIISFRSKARKTGVFALTAIVLFGSLLYMTLFFQVFDLHDYYLINISVVIPLMLLSCLFFLKNTRPNTFLHIRTKIAGIIVLGFLIYATAARTRIKYRTDDNWAINAPVIDEETRNYWNWYHWHYAKTKNALTGIEPYLSSIGVNSDDKIVSLSDGSINVSLYLMNRKGFTAFWLMKNEENMKISNPSERMEKWISWGAKYLIIYDENQLSEEYLQPYLTEKIGQRKNVHVFEL
jgi:hypothetical protein